MVKNKTYRKEFIYKWIKKEEAIWNEEPKIKITKLPKLCYNNNKSTNLKK